MDRGAHYFPMGARCAWCGASQSDVEDRRAPPWCEARPEDLRPEPPSDNDSTGY